MVTAGTRALLNMDDSDSERAQAEAIIRGWLLRHRRGDWGIVDEHDKRVNYSGLQIMNGQAVGRVVSAYDYEGNKVWVITERGRHETTVLLPEEY